MDKHQIFQCAKRLIAGALIVGVWGCGVWFGREMPSRPAPASDGGLLVCREDGTVTVQGLDCDRVSLAGANSLYLANIRFVPALAEERTETSVTYDPDTGCLHVGIVADRGGAGALAGPMLTYTLDCADGSIAASAATPYEGETLTLEESQMVSLGKLALELLHLCQSGQEIYRYWDGALASP